jgi:transcriptional regulator with XRE-family HTH domain
MIDDMLRIDFEKIEEVRKRKKLSQKAVAEAGDIGLRTYSRIASAAQGHESSQVRDFRLSTVWGIAQALGVRAKSILKDDPDPAE